MKVGVEVVGHVSILLDDVHLFLSAGKLLEHAAAFGCLVVCLSEIADGDGLGTVFGSYPVAVGKVDADGCRGVEVAAEDGCFDDLGCDAFDFIFLEFWCYRTVVFKPLCVGAQQFCAFGCLHVLEVDDALP